MSHEISQTLYDLAYQQRRAEQAEALARTLQAQRDAAERDNAGLLAILRALDYADPVRAERILADVRDQQHPGRALMARTLAELARLREGLLAIEAHHVEQNRLKGHDEARSHTLALARAALKASS